MTNKAWCPLPWLGLNVRNNGDVRVCCNANVSVNQGLVSKEDGTYYNLGKDKIQDFRNAKLMKEIRLAMLEGKYHESCIRCQREAESDMISRADWERDIWAHEITEKSSREITASDGSINTDQNPIKYMDLRFGNLCNLKCRMCGPTDSNMWYEDTVKLWGPQYTDSGQKIKLIKNNKGKHKPDVDIYSWYKNKDFWQDLESEIPVVERLYIVGGEPLIIDQHYEFLQKCIDANRADKIVIEYNTNITNIPERAWNIWKHFQRVQIGMSIDAVGPINDYIRNPSKWWKIEENMRKLDSAEGNFKVWWAATIQAYNLVHLPETMMWKINQNFKRINVHIDYKSVISPHPLHNPKFLNIKIFPKESKEWIETNFEEWKKRSEVEIENHLNRKHFCKILDTYIKYMWAEDYSDQLAKFWYYTRTLDASRNENLKLVSPKTWELLKGNLYE
jgi:MoaA/NifB/PqqE/SkfB family radical SAM enzyme